MTTEWIYPVNLKSDSWGYRHRNGELATPRQVMAEPDTFEHGAHSWHVPRQLRLGIGDWVWVRESLPLGAFIGVGFVNSVVEWRTPTKDGPGWYFDVVWDTAVCAAMSENPVRVDLDKRAQSTRTLTPAERRRLRSAVRPLSGAPVPPIGKLRRTQEVVVRQGQQAFRARLMRAYGGRCAITGDAVAEVLQAAHIEPYDGLRSNAVINGLLLRADVHNLFDLGMISVNASMRVSLHISLRRSKEYGSLHGKKLRLPSDQADCPDPRKLALHRSVIAGM